MYQVRGGAVSATLCLTPEELYDLTQKKREIADVPILALDELRRLPQSNSLDGGIYFLWSKDQLQYIGKSRQICNRIDQHEWARDYPRRRPKTIPFDRHTCIALDSGRLVSKHLDEQLKRLERAYIARYQPPFNCPHENPGT